MSARSIRRSRIVGSTVAAIVALAAALGGAAPAGAEPPPPVAKYVALGDSYAAGQGAGVPLDQCLRSAAAYPVLLDAEPRTNLLRFAACSGATIDDVLSSQLSQVNRGTTLVTVTVGANDLGAGAAYAVCVPNPASPECGAALAMIVQTLQSGDIAADLTALILAIAERAPNAHIVVTDYPIPFVYGLGAVTDAINDATIALNAQIAAAVQAAAALGADVELASVQLAFAGHAVGSNDPWLGADTSNPITFLHPTAAGQQAYRAAILAALAT
jgi:lysophospholipase L1-like esterase